MNKFLLHVNGMMAKSLEVLNPIIAVSVFIGVMRAVDDFGSSAISSLLAGAVAACMVSGPIAVLTNIRSMLRDATRDQRAGGVES